jgi:flagellar basal-body rod modification protein FlgD
MSVTGISDNDSAADNARKLQRTQMGPDDFMTLFLTQLKMQDPLKPMDNTAMLQQMAELGQLSSSKELNATIKSMNVNMGKTQIMAASQLVNRHAQFPSGVSPLVDGDGMGGSVVLGQPVSDVTITIKDKTDHVLKTIKLPASGTGVVDFHWDGLDDSGNKVAPDFYNISASATVDGKQVAVPTAGTFKINSVALNPNTGEVILNVEGLGGMSMNNLIKIL